MAKDTPAALARREHALEIWMSNACYVYFIYNKNGVKIEIKK